MPPRRERVWPGLVGRYGVFVTVLGVVATAVYAAVDADDRSTVLRLAVAAFVLVVLGHIHSAIRRRLEWERPSAFDQARRGQPVEAKVAPVVARLRKQVEFSLSSQRYFKDVLWPRLAQLAEERGTRRQLVDPPGRRWLRRGPSLAAIAELLRRIGGER